MKTPPSRTLLETADAAAQQIFLSMLLGYYAMVRKLVDLFSRMAELDGKLSRLYQSRPSGVMLHLTGPELLARDLEQFSREHPRCCG